MFRRFKRALGALGLASLFAPAAAPVPTRAQTRPEPVASVEGITEYRLENGLRVLLFPDASKPQITVNVTYLVGSRHEGYGETGMAHLLEHLIFKGTPSHPDIMKELTERGAQPNGTTSLDRTNYYEIFPAEEGNLEWAIDLEADRMVNSAIAEEDLDSEMTVVRNEMEAGENNPLGILFERVLSTQYLWHNYANSTIGARSDVENVPIERLQAFYRKYYQPDNAVLVVAGNFDGETALDLIVDRFGAIPRPSREGPNIIYPTYTREPTQDGERMVTLRRVGDVQYVMTSYHVPAGSHPDFPAVQVLAYALGDTPSGRLYKALVETDLATQAAAFAQQLKEAGPLLTFAEVRTEDDLDAAWRVMNETVEGVLQSPITGEEVSRAKAAMLKQIELSFANSAGIALQLSEWASMGDWRLLFLDRDRIEAVTADDVNRVAQAYLKPDNRTVGLFRPTERPDRAEIPEPVDVSSMVEGYTGREAVAAGEAFDPSPENIDARTLTLTLSNGMEVALLPKETRGDAVVFRIRLHFGDERSLRGRVAAGDMAGDMLMRGTTQRTRQEIQDELDRLKASGGLGGDATTGTGQFTTVRESLPDVIRLAAEILREPSFPEGEFRVLKEQQLAGLEEQRSDPIARAQVALARHMEPWPDGHPLRTSTLDEAMASLEGVSLRDAVRFYEDFYGPQSGNLVVVGDFDPDSIGPVLEEAFGDWESPHAFARIPEPFKSPEPQELAIETPDKANAILIAQQNLELRDTDPDYPALVLAGYALGGGPLNSRLARRIRVEAGLSYAVAGAVTGHPIDPVGQFLAYAIFAPENADAVEELFRDEMSRVLADGLTDEEVQTARQGYLETLRLARSQDATLASQLASKLYFGRTFGFDAAFEARVRALTTSQVNDAIRRRIDLTKMTVVKAGDFAAARPPVGL